MLARPVVPLALALFLVGCDPPPPPSPAPAADKDTPAADAGPCVTPMWGASTAGASCDPSPDCDIGRPAAIRCACAGPETTPPAAASIGARCAPVGDPHALTCCVWFVEAPFLLLWENCGEGWKCTGAKCPRICHD